jgi:hypothetical protein
MRKFALKELIDTSPNHEILETKLRFLQPGTLDSKSQFSSVLKE